MAGEHDWTDPSIGYRWIKANVYGALVTAVLGLVAYALGRVLGVDDPDVTLPAMLLFSVGVAVITALAWVWWAWLTAGALGRKLPGFPVRPWVLLHAVIGLAAGAFYAAYDLRAVVIEPDPDAMLGTTLTVMIVHLLVSAALGSIEALVLRKAARGLQRWIGYSALAGLVMGPSHLAAMYWPQSGWSGELMSGLSGIILMMIAAAILLPAVRRLQARDVNPSPAAPSPP